MNKLFIVFILLLSFCISGTALSNEWYLSPTGSDTTGDGTIDNPWYSPAKARKSRGTISPGDIVIFLNGTYTWTDKKQGLLGYSADDSGSSGARITYKAETDGLVTINASGGQGWFLQKTNGSAYITLKGFNIVNTTGGISIYDKNIEIINCNITACLKWPADGNPISTASWGGITAIMGADNFLIEGCHVDYFSTVESAHGIYVAGGSGIIRNSIWTNNIGNGIQIQAKSDHELLGAFKVYRNKVYNNTGRHGIYVSAYGGGTIERVDVYNNLVWNSGINYASGWGITLGSSEGVGVKVANVWNNTVFGCRGGINFNAMSGSLQNNIIVNSASSDFSYATSINKGVIKDHNLTTNGSEDGASDSFAVSNFQSIDEDSPNFLKVKGSAATAVNMGVNTGITDDFSGNSRPKYSDYDIGAYEYNVNAPIVTGINVK